MSKLYQHRLLRGLILNGFALAIVSKIFAQETKQPAAEAPAVSTEQTIDPFVVPDGATAEELLAFLDSIRKTDQRSATRERPIPRLRKAIRATSTAVDRLLAGRATDEQRTRAIEQKIHALATAVDIDAPQAEEQLATFLDRVRDTSSPQVHAKLQGLLIQADQMLLLRRFDRWNHLQPREKDEFFDDVVQSVNGDQPPIVSQAQFVSRIGDQLAHSAERERAAATVEQLLPVFKTSTDPGVVSRLDSMEGLVRRLRLPGNKMEVSGTLLNGETLNWQSYRGKVVLVDYWATWCGPCKAEVPNVLENYRAYRDKGFEVLGISLNEEKAEVEEYLSQAGIPWPTLYSSEKGASGWDHPMVKYYGIHGIPTAILVDRDGTVVEMQARGARLGEKLRELLGEPVLSVSATEAADSDDRAVRANATLPN